MLPDHKHRPVKAGTFFLKVGRSQQNANQADKILNRVQVIAHPGNGICPR
jgi:hypothetical protein